MPDPGSLMTAESLADLLETLVNIPSETGHEGPIADWIAARLARRGGGECLRSGHSVVWRAAPRGRPLLVLAGHLDTVPANGNARARREAGRLVGLGASDMKSGDAVMLALLEGLDRVDAEPGPRVGSTRSRAFRSPPPRSRASSSARRSRSRRCAPAGRATWCPTS